MLLAKSFHQNHQAVLAAVSINGLMTRLFIISCVNKQLNLSNDGPTFVHSTRPQICLNTI